MNTENLKKKTLKAIEKLPDEATVLRSRVNEFNEPCGRDVVAVIRGQYYHGGYNRGRNEFVSLNMSENGRTMKNFPEKFMTVIDENTSRLRVGDILALGVQLYEITDLGGNFGVYYDLSLERL